MYGRCWAAGAGGAAGAGCATGGAWAAGWLNVGRCGSPAGPLKGREFGTCAPGCSFGGVTPGRLGWNGGARPAVACGAVNALGRGVAAIGGAPWLFLTRSAWFWPASVW